MYRPTTGAGSHGGGLGGGGAGGGGDGDGGGGGRMVATHVEFESNSLKQYIILFQALKP